MKNLTQILLLTALTVFTACRKDPAYNLPEPKGNLLIIDLDSDFNIMGGIELVVPQLSINSNQMELEILNTDYHWTMLATGTNDTIFHLDNGNLMQPEISSLSTLSEQDDRLFNFLEEDDINPLYGLSTDKHILLQKIGNIKLVHSYFSKEKHSKIEVLKIARNEFDPDLNISYPVVKQYLLIGYEF